MKAIIHEWIKPDEQEPYESKIYEVPDLSEELERIDKSGAICTLSATFSNYKQKCPEVFITYFI